MTRAARAARYYLGGSLRTMLEFKAAARSKKPIQFTIEGQPHVYKFVPPKRASMALPILTGEIETMTDQDMGKVIFDWLGSGLSKSDVERLIDRLSDPEDDLDIDILESILKGLMEAIGGRPTT